jgi:SAM-dependent methyltransferase
MTETGKKIMQNFKDFYQTRFQGNYGDGMYDINALLRLSALKKWLVQHKSFKYLEVGSGTGRFAITLVERLKGFGYTPEEVCLSDLDNHLAAPALALGRFKACNLGHEPLPYNDKAFNLVICNHVLEHVFETEKTLRELRRVTAPNGLVVLGVPNIGNWYSRFMFLLGFMPLGLECGTESVAYGKGPGKSRCKGFIPSGHIRGFNARALREICGHCGLEVVNWWNQGVEPHAKLMYRYLGAVTKPV